MGGLGRYTCWVKRSPGSQFYIAVKEFGKLVLNFGVVAIVPPRIISAFEGTMAPEASASSPGAKASASSPARTAAATKSPESPKAQTGPEYLQAVVAPMTHGQGTVVESDVSHSLDAA